jgi:hypothetical protein
MRAIREADEVIQLPEEIVVCGTLQVYTDREHKNTLAQLGFRMLSR